MPAARIVVRWCYWLRRVASLGSDGALRRSMIAEVRMLSHNARVDDRPYDAFARGSVRSKGCVALHGGDRPINAGTDLKVGPDPIDAAFLDAALGLLVVPCGQQVRFREADKAAVVRLRNANGFPLVLIQFFYVSIVFLLLPRLDDVLLVEFVELVFRCSETAVFLQVELYDVERLFVDTFRQA